MWPPFLAGDGVAAPAGWTTITRAEGTRQWAYKGKPVYRYTQDAFAGGQFGDGVDSVWRIAFIPIPMPAEIRQGPTVLGKVLTDAKGMTLYTAAADAPGGKPGCSGQCLWSWTPVTAPMMARAFADWTVVELDNGSRQWAFKGKPLYRHVGDISVGEINGTKQKGWSATVLEPAAPRPSFTTVNASDAGEIVGNEQGLTLYSRELNPRLRRFFQNPNCEGECVDPIWLPVMAPPDAKPVGSWMIIDIDGGKRQWTYKGNKVYTNVNDKKPGDFRGIRFGGDRTFSAIMRSGLQMQGTTVGG
jgi:predicted lipoprotein with Yx(FWY)xxD motif